MSKSPRPTVFLVHGRDHLARQEMATFLEAVGVRVLTWGSVLSILPPDQHGVWQVVSKGFDIADAAVIVSTPDEVSFLRPELWKSTDPEGMRIPRFQSRQNVFVELGYSLHGLADRTIHVKIGNIDSPSDFDGRWVASIPDLPAIEFRTFLAEALTRLLASSANESASEDHHAMVQNFIANVENRRDEWISAGDIDGLINRELRRGDPPRLIEAGVEVKASRFRYSEFFAGGSEFILTGTNFGDQFGSVGMPPSLLHQLVVAKLKSDPASQIFLVLSPFEILGQLHEIGFRHLRDFSSARMLMLQEDPRLTDSERARLKIFDHPGAMLLAIAIRDPDPATNMGLAIVTPRWLTDDSGPTRMYFAVEQRSNPRIFSNLVRPIYPNIKIDAGYRGGGGNLLGGRSIRQICEQLGVAEDPYTSKLFDTPIYGT